MTQSLCVREKENVYLLNTDKDRRRVWVCERQTKYLPTKQRQGQEERVCVCVRKRVCVTNKMFINVYQLTKDKDRRRTRGFSTIMLLIYILPKLSAGK